MKTGERGISDRINTIYGIRRKRLLTGRRHVITVITL